MFPGFLEPNITKSEMDSAHYEATLGITKSDRDSAHYEATLGITKSERDSPHPLRVLWLRSLALTPSSLVVFVIPRVAS